MHYIIQVTEFILVIEEHKIRGTAENVYQLNRAALEVDDEDFIQFLKELNEVASKYMSKPVTEKSVSRQITLVSSPVDI